MRFRRRSFQSERRLATRWAVSTIVRLLHAHAGGCGAPSEKSSELQFHRPAMRYSSGQKHRRPASISSLIERDRTGCVALGKKDELAQSKPSRKTVNERNWMMSWLTQTMKKNIPAALAVAAFGAVAPAMVATPAMADAAALHPTHINYMTHATPCDGSVASKLQHPGGFCGPTPYGTPYYGRYGAQPFAYYRSPVLR